MRFLSFPFRSSHESRDLYCTDVCPEPPFHCLSLSLSLGPLSVSRLPLRHFQEHVGMEVGHVRLSSHSSHFPESCFSRVGIGCVSSSHARPIIKVPCAVFSGV